ncbi:hypothetical protein EDB81DRAFT_939615 [Dactylonectria macrodidyma]|uniref:Uncharacterized protein n=1 Tax=Dactylonectria macrodidyma TaxID=307937 RepID=A0A9P9JI11_9HYPO|nr:hypothetical protein EDB81DRAFT_939615 [Dactylonectria macrodidyma]
MKTTVFITILSAAASFVSAGIVITPIFSNQIVEKSVGDCPYGVVTPQGCGPKRG